MKNTNLSLNLTDIAIRLYKVVDSYDHWDSLDYSAEQAIEDIKSSPNEIIDYLLTIIENENENNE